VFFSVSSRGNRCYRALKRKRAIHWIEQCSARTRQQKRNTMDWTVLGWHEVPCDPLERSESVAICRVHGILRDVLGVPSVRCWLMGTLPSCIPR